MGEKILIVDDDNAFRKEFRNCLEEYEVLDVPSGQEALGLLRKPNDIAVVTLDVKMPGLDGMTILKEIRRLSPDVGIIMITGYSSKDVAVESLRGHADDYVEKPVDMNKVKEIIERILAVRKGRIDTSSLELDDKMNKVKRFIEKNISRSVRLKDAALSVCLSPKYLSRIFREKTGMRFSEYRLRLAVIKAKELLTNTAYTVGQIAYNIGYKNGESFIRQFKRAAGITPKVFRIKKRRKSGNVKK